MKTRARFYIILIVIIFLSVFSFAMLEHAKKALSGGISDPSACAVLPFCKGEKITYDVYYRNIRIGKSVLEFHGEETLDGINTYHITFSTNVAGFEDVEDIYAHKDTLLPFKIQRNIKRLGYFPVKIREHYDQEAFRVNINERGTLFSKNFSIQKDAPLFNAILLPYYYRVKPDISNGGSFRVVLPVADFNLILRGKEIIMTGIGAYSAYVFGSEPSHFTFWLSADERRIPLKIEGYDKLSYSLIIHSIESPI